MLIKCPNCGKQAEYSDSNPYRPFCSERCRYIDFGDWIEEKNRIQDKENSFIIQSDTETSLNKH